MQLKYNHTGDSYISFLSRFHSFLEPATYLEIGTLNGRTLELAKCATIAIDPMFKLEVDAIAARPATLFFQSTSDTFFNRYNPAAILGRAVDLAFLDGLHQAETLLRDFANVEAHCNPNSVIVLHDCIPMNEEMTCRENNGVLWTGDVWKLVPILRHYRSDLRIYSFDAGPTGLICITGLDPTSTVLKEDYFKIMREWEDVELETYGFDRMLKEAGIRWTETVRTREAFTRYFWL